MEQEQLTALFHGAGPQTRAHRRRFHEHPELSGIEKEAGARILEVVRTQEFFWEMVGDYGITTRIGGGFEGEAVVLRTDMDALSVKRSWGNLSGEEVSVSGNDGVSHVCGHNVHMVMMSGAMLMLNRLKSQLHGTALVVFGRAKKTDRDVDQMMEALKQYPVDICYAIHVYVGPGDGRLCIQPEERMAVLTSFIARVRRKDGHASRPDLTVNPLVCMAQILVNLNSIWTGETNPTKTVTLGIGAMKCGERGNVIADERTFSDTMRYFDMEREKKALGPVKRVCMLVTKAHRRIVGFERIPQTDCFVVNDVSCSERTASGIRELFGEEVLTDCEPQFAMKSMRVYLVRYPGVLVFLGIRDEEHGYGVGHHMEEFDLDEGVSIRGCGVAVKYVVDTLEEQ